MNNGEVIKWGLASIMLFSIMILSAVPRSSFLVLVSIFTIFFGCYLFINNTAKNFGSVGFWVSVAILLRVSTLFFFPNLSDDIYRFIWDGELLRQGLNPFNHTPFYFIENAIPNIEIDQSLYAHLNSPDYYSIYPPIAQLLFGLGSYLFEGSWALQAGFLKTVILAAEIGTLFFIRKILVHCNWPQKRILWYALNPLVIVELCGNIHFEGIMIFFFILSFWLLIKEKYFLAGMAYGFSFLTKLVTAIASPYLLKRITFKGLILTILGGLIVTILGFLPLLNARFGANFGDSLNLYFQKFEFNASLYYIARWVGFEWKGWNMIAKFGPYLAATGMMIILAAVLVDRGRKLSSFPIMALFGLTVYFLFGTTVHPWYITTLVALCTFTSFRYPVLWSYLIFLTYINYSYENYFENLWVVGIEYTLLFGYLGWRLFKQLKEKGTPT